MADFGLGDFNADTVEPMPSREPIPVGWYECCIVASEMKTTKDGSGQYLELTFEVLSGPYMRRKLWCNLNLHNKSDKAVQIAKAQLAAICKAVSVPRPRDSVELHNLPLQVRVGMRKDQDGNPQNNVADFKANGAAQAGGRQQGQAARENGGNRAPWVR